jgi:hypothetical protein
MNKRTLDTLGGVGSFGAALVCIYFAVGHSYHEDIWTVWVVFSVLLVLNGILMLVHARRQGGLPAVAKELMHKTAKPMEHKHS